MKTEGATGQGNAVELALLLSLAAAAALLLAARAGDSLDQTLVALQLADGPAARLLFPATVTLLIPVALGSMWALRRRLAGDKLDLTWRMALASFAWNVLLCLGLGLTGRTSLWRQLSLGAECLSASVRVATHTQSPAPPSSGDPRGATPRSAEEPPAPVPAAPLPPEMAALPGATYALPGGVHPSTQATMDDLFGRFGQATIKVFEALWYLPAKRLDDPEARRQEWERQVRLAPAHASIARSLGFELLRGTKVRQDLDAARYWLHEACKRKDPGACRILSHLHCAGLLVPRDRAKAASYARGAALGRALNYACELDWYDQNQTGSCPDYSTLEAWSLRRSQEGFRPCTLYLTTESGLHYGHIENVERERPEIFRHLKELHESGETEAGKPIAISSRQWKELLRRTTIPPP